MPTAATSRHPRTHPVRFAAPALGRDPPPRPTSPSTRFAPTLRHSATWASPPPSDRSVLPPSRRAPASAPRRSPMPHASGRQRSLRVSSTRIPTWPMRQSSTPCPPTTSRHTRLAASGGIAPLMPYDSLRSPSAPPSMSASPVRAPPVTGFRFPPRPVSVTPRTPLPEPPAPRFAAPSAPSALHASPRPAPVLPMTNPIVDAPTSSVHQSSTPCLAPTSRQPLGSSPPATSPGSRRPPRYARPRRRSRTRRGRWLRIIIVAGDAVHVHDAADHHAMSCPAPVTPPSATTPVNVSVMTIMAWQP